MATPDGSGSCHLQKRDLLGLGLGFLGELCFALLVFVSRDTFLEATDPSSQLRTNLADTAGTKDQDRDLPGSKSARGHPDCGTAYQTPPRANSRQVSRV